MTGVAKNRSAQESNMNRITVTSKVGSDGVLRLSLPVGLDERSREDDI
jgi:hypothetical protein